MGLEEHELRTWVRQVATGKASRRDFLRAMLGLGLAGPLIVEMLATPPPARAQETLGRIDPQGLMGQFVSWEMAQKANNWAGQNTVRWANAEYDRLWQQARTELDPVKRAALFIRMNDLVIEDVVVIPVAWVKEVHAVSQTLRGLALSPWDLATWDLAYWYREA